MFPMKGFLSSVRLPTEPTGSIIDTTRSMYLARTHALALAQPGHNESSRCPILTTWPTSPRLSLCDDLTTHFGRLGYEVLPLLTLPSTCDADRGLQITLRSPLEAGGYQEALIEIVGDLCIVYTGEIYPRPVKAAPPRPWRRSEHSLSGRDIVQGLLRKVREMLLDES